MRMKVLTGILTALAALTAPATASAKVLLWENFTTALRSGELDPRWKVVSEGTDPGPSVTASVVDDGGNHGAVLHLSGAGTAIFGSPSWGDYTLEVDVKVVDDAYGAWGAGAFFRVTGSGTIYGSDAYVFQGRAPGYSGMQLEQWNNGAWWNWLQSTAQVMTPREWHHLKVTVTGPRIQAWIDDQPSIDFTDPSGTHLQGTVGARVWGAGAYFDNLLVTDASPLVIGGFDAARGGHWSWAEGAEFAPARQSVAAKLSGASYVKFPTVTPEALAGLDVVVLVPATGCCSPIVPLSEAEQAALRAFVDGGGCAILTPDNSTFHPGGPEANRSLVAPFGMSPYGTLGGWNTATVTDPAASPVTDGPFGVVSTFRQNYPGALADLGPYATPLATNALGVALATIDAGVTAQGSGRVVVFTDGNTFGSRNMTGDYPPHEALWLNAIAWCSQPADVVAPDTTATLDGKAGNAPWLTSAVGVTLGATDPAPYATGVAATEYRIGADAFTAYAGPFTVSAQGETAVCFRSVDRAGNVEQPRCRTIQIDTEPPVAIGLPAGEYLLRQVVLAGWTVSDPVSGVASATGTVPPGQPIDTVTVGTKEFWVTAEDVSGNSGTTRSPYFVRYGFPGFTSPKTATEKIGNTIPIKFALLDAAGAIVADATPRLEVRSPTGAVQDKGLIRFDPLEQQYVYQLSTKGFDAGTWTFSAVLGDGATKSVQVTLDVK